MNGGKIGIKLTDGKFYGVLDAFIANKKKLELEFADTGNSTVEIELFYLNEKSEPHSIKIISVENLKILDNVFTVILSLCLNERGVLSCVLQDKHSETQTHIQFSFLNYINEQKKLVAKKGKIIHKAISQTSTQGLGSSEVEAIFSNCDYPFQGKKSFFELLSVGISFICIFISVGTLVFTVSKSKNSPLTNSLQLPVVAANINEDLASDFLADSPLSSPMFGNIFSSQSVSSADKSNKTDFSQVATTILTTKDQYLQPLENKITVSRSKNILPQNHITPYTGKDQRYQIFWGDTLLDISLAYYRTPWLYHYIARHNEIKNTDYIIAGKWIMIPSK
ncbi:MAG: hypothetical protein ACRC4W_04800 [Treponemataceae bacterium]